MKGKSKSSHDLIDDPKLSSVPAVDTDEKEKLKRKIEESVTEELESAEVFVFLLL